MCPKSFALGLWRGSHLRARDVPLAGHIDPNAYRAGYGAGRRKRLAAQVAAQMTKAAA